MSENRHLTLMDIAFLFGSIPSWVTVAMQDVMLDTVKEAFPALIITYATYRFGKYLRKNDQ